MLLAALAALPRPAAAQKVRLTIVQLNDVYEINPIQGGRYGGLARVAALTRQLKAASADCVLVVLSGDFLSPSLYGSVNYAGQRVAGLQMVETLDAMGLDWVTFGNHEFDINEAELLARIDASRFGWIASNTFHRTQAGAVEPFRQRGRPLPPYKLLSIGSPKGDTLRLGMLGLTLPYNRKPFVYYADVNATADSLARVLADSADALVALTHLNIGEDLDLAKRTPALRLLMGGHEHANDFHRVGRVVVAKADANARTVYVHRLRWRWGRLKVKSRLMTIDAKLGEDSATQAVARRWTERLYVSLRELGFQPDEVIGNAAVPLDGLESHVRSQQTNLGRLIGEAMCAAGDKPVAAIYNAGSIRVDDQLSGTLTQVDILRTLPFGGGAVEMDVRGATLLRMLAAGEANRGSGGYLQVWGIEGDAGKGWRVKGQAIDPQAVYRIMTTEYMSLGKEKNLDFVKSGGEGIERVHQPATWPDGTPNDVRWLLIRHLQRQTAPLR